MPINDDASSSVLVLRSGRRISKKTDNESIVSVRHASDQGNDPAFPFLKLPAELRIQVYRYLLHALCNISIDSSAAVKARFWRRFKDNDVSQDWETYRETYTVTAIGLHPAILSANKQTYLEATRILYSENRFSFRPYKRLNKQLNSATAIAGVIPFLEDRGEGPRRLIREIEYYYIVINSPQIEAELDRVFAKMCNYLSQNLQLQHVTLNLASMSTKSLLGSSLCRTYLANIHKHNWVQTLVPFAKKLKILALVGRDDGDAELVRIAQTYLDSKMAEASNTSCQS